MTAPTALDRTQRSEIAKAARSEEILDAARRVFAEKGFKGTTIADIAESAGIALGTIYLYFPSKDEVFAALNKRFVELITSAITSGKQIESLEGSVHDRVDSVFAVCAANRDLVRLVVLNTDPNSAAERRIKARAPSHERLVEAFTSAQQHGLIRNAEAVTMVNLCFGLVSIAVYQAFVISDGTDADGIRNECAEMVIAYLRPVEA